MQTIKFSSKKSNWLLLLVVAAFSILTISSCQETPPKGSCISLSRSKIEKAWGDYIKNGQIDYVSFITFYNPINHEINVSVQAFDSSYKPIGPFVKLLTESGCANLLPKVRVGENISTPADLEILTGSGRDLKEFAYLALKPQADSSGHLVYQTRVVDKNDKTIMAAKGTLPCPPCINCRPPCPPDCTPICTPEEQDSLLSLNKIKVIRDTANNQ